MAYFTIRFPSRPLCVRLVPASNIPETICFGQAVAVVVGVHLDRGSDLLQIRLAADRLCPVARQWLSSLDVLLLTFGTSWVYEDGQTGCIVGNCHKLPESCFRRRRLSVEEIVDDYTDLLTTLWKQRPGLRVILTVSPIRHVRDGLHANQLSKATLLLAIDALQQQFAGRIFYFPAYELLNDELRDYRFYADDLVHPSDLAVGYVWQRFSEACFAKETLQIIEESENIGKMLQHKPFRPESEEYKRFLGQIVLKIDRLNRKYPYLDFKNEREICHTRLKI